jgi:hypothetical protein
MSGSGTRSGLHPDYFILDDPSATGPVIGTYAGRPFTAAVVDDLGRRFVFAGIAPRRRDGTFDTDMLSDGEWIVQPGLVYRSDPDVAVEKIEELATHLGPDLT